MEGDEWTLPDKAAESNKDEDPWYITDYRGVKVVATSSGP